MPFGRDFHSASTSANQHKGAVMKKKLIEEIDVLKNMGGSDAPEGTETQIDLEDGHSGTQSPANPAPDPSPEDRSEFSRWLDSLPPLD
jgi:hypothetical protein